MKVMCSTFTWPFSLRHFLKCGTGKWSSDREHLSEWREQRLLLRDTEMEETCKVGSRKEKAGHGSPGNMQVGALKSWPTI